MGSWPQNSPSTIFQLPGYLQDTLQTLEHPKAVLWFVFEAVSFTHLCGGLKKPVYRTQDAQGFITALASKNELRPLHLMSLKLRVQGPPLPPLSLVNQGRAFCYMASLGCLGMFSVTSHFPVYTEDLKRAGSQGE